jgi:hypothetical protein
MTTTRAEERMTAIWAYMRLGVVTHRCWPMATNTERSQRMKNFLQDSWDEIRSRMQERRAAEVEDARLDGYETAAEVVLGILTRRIDGLQGKLGNLTKDEQVALRNLHELRRAAEADLAAHLRQGPQHAP